MIITDTISRKLPSREKQKSKGKSRFIGVRFYGNDKRQQLKRKRIKEIRKEWRAHITIDNSKIFLGFFYSEIGAARAYNKEAIKVGRTLNLIN